MCPRRGQVDSSRFCLVRLHALVSHVSEQLRPPSASPSTAPSAPRGTQFTTLAAAGRSCLWPSSQPRAPRRGGRPVPHLRRTCGFVTMSGATLLFSCGHVDRPIDREAHLKYPTQRRGTSKQASKQARERRKEPQKGKQMRARSMRFWTTREGTESTEGGWGCMRQSHPRDLDSKAIFIIHAHANFLYKNKLKHMFACVRAVSLSYAKVF